MKKMTSGFLAAAVVLVLTATSAQVVAYSEDALFLKADQLQRDGKTDDALAELDRIVAAGQRNPLQVAQALLRKGEILCLKKEYAAALESLDRASRLVAGLEERGKDPGALSFNIERCRYEVHSAKGEWNEAKAVAIRLIGDVTLNSRMNVRSGKETVALPARVVGVDMLAGAAAHQLDNDPKAVDKAMSETVEKYPGTLIAGEAYLEWATFLAYERKQFPQALEKLEAAARLLETDDFRVRNLQGWLADKTGKQPEILEEPWPTTMKSVLSVEPGLIEAWEAMLPDRIVAECDKVLSRENVPPLTQAVVRYLRAASLKDMGKGDAALQEIEVAGRLCQASLATPRKNNLIGRLRILAGQIMESIKKPEEATVQYRRTAQDPYAGNSTRFEATSALTSVVGKTSGADGPLAVAKEMQQLLEVATPDRFKGFIDLAWAEWLTSHGDFDAAAKKLGDAAKILGDKSVDVKEGLSLLKKAEEAKKAK